MSGNVCENLLQWKVSINKKKRVENVLLNLEYVDTFEVNTSKSVHEVKLKLLKIRRYRRDL